MRAIDSDIVCGMTMADGIERSPFAWMQHSTAWLATGFAAMVLALTGLCGISREVRRMNLRESAGLSGAVLQAGLFLTALVARFVRKLFFGISLGSYRHGVR